ncbi:hypothetical protein HK104_006309 [Borealophlyctis nickersoniae]|nr:hypothetical protein HK104_006309 [Borealophlyctis nickersoniae]
MSAARNILNALFSSTSSKEPTDASQPPVAHPSASPQPQMQQQHPPIDFLHWDPFEFPDLNHRQSIMRQTYLLCSATSPTYTADDGDKPQVTLPLGEMLQNVQKTCTFVDADQLDRSTFPKLSAGLGGRTTVRVVQGDCLTAARELIGKRLRPFVLNMANPVEPGEIKVMMIAPNPVVFVSKSDVFSFIGTDGDKTRGAGAQEENLFRRSNYAMHLIKARASNGEWGVGDVRYPIPDAGAIYSPDVVVFRGEESQGYPFLSQPYKVAMVACAAIYRPELTTSPTGAQTYPPHVATIYKRKIRAMLNIGLLKGHDAAVLSAFGCGAFMNPPGAMAELFRQVIGEEYMANGAEGAAGYKEIVFAIFDDQHTGMRHNPEGNLVPFQKMLGGLEVM